MKGKSFASGLIIGLITATTITALAAGPVGSVVNAWLPGTAINIIIDGKPVEIPEDMPVLEYQGRYYAAARLIAESLGAEVTFLDSRNAISIKSPEPIKEYIEIEKIVEKEVQEVFHKAPVRQIIQNVTMNITGISRSSEKVDRTYIYLDVLNMYGQPVTLDHDNAYIMIDGVKYESIHSNNVNWGNSISPSDYIKEDTREYSIEGQMVFKYIPSDARDMKVVIPVIYENYNTRIPKEERTHLFEFNVTFEN